MIHDRMSSFKMILSAAATADWSVIAASNIYFLFSLLSPHMLLGYALFLSSPLPHSTGKLSPKSSHCNTAHLKNRFSFLPTAYSPACFMCVSNTDLSADSNSAGTLYQSR
jgi:hypothetical protein